MNTYRSLSILIPVYNRSVSQLVIALHNQLNIVQEPFEIIVVDDHSNSQIASSNANILTLQNVRYEVLDKNIGRSKIRNYLVAISQYERLLFLDCDSGIVDNHFIERYINTKAQVCYGGTIYSAIEPPKNNLLHWRYGKKYEALTVNKRRENPSSSFRSNNFMIEKSIITVFPFDEDIKEYGHEDSLLANTLHKNNIAISHIANPVYHLGLEDNDTFIKKIETSLDNLHQIRINNPAFSTRIWVVKEKIEGIELLSFLLANSITIIKKLLIHFPNPYILQLYKLCYLLKRTKFRLLKGTKSRQVN